MKSVPRLKKTNRKRRYKKLEKIKYFLAIEDTRREVGESSNMIYRE